MQQPVEVEETCGCSKKSCAECNKYKHALGRSAKKHVPTGYFTKIKSDYPVLLEELGNITEHNYTGKHCANKCHICDEEFMDAKQNKVIRELLFDKEKVNKILENEPEAISYDYDDDYDL